jgi:hypothetical protein
VRLAGGPPANAEPADQQHRVVAEDEQVEAHATPGALNVPAVASAPTAAKLGSSLKFVVHALVPTVAVRHGCWARWGVVELSRRCSKRAISRPTSSTQLRSPALPRRNSRTISRRRAGAKPKLGGRIQRAVVRRISAAGGADRDEPGRFADR